MEIDFDLHVHFNILKSVYTVNSFGFLSEKINRAFNLTLILQRNKYKYVYCVYRIHSRYIGIRIYLHV